MIRRLISAVTLMLVATAANAENLPQFPKIGPPSPLPDPACDTAAASDGAWLVGRWVGPGAKWLFTRDGFGWREGAVITGSVAAASGCTVTLAAGDNAFLFEGVLTDGGKLYGYAVNPKGDQVRFVLRRER
jgi:hypothetical protein